MGDQAHRKKNILTIIGDFFKYLLNKRSEIYDLDFKDALLAQANVRIYRTRTHKEIELVSLKSLQYIHRLDRENAQNALKKRIEVIRENQSNIAIDGIITMEALVKHLPSVSFIKVIANNKGDYLAFEGNGRIAALKDVYGDRKDVFVEVERYYFKNDKNVLKMLHRIRHLNGLI